jgi:3-dehydroquinate synthase
MRIVGVLLQLGLPVFAPELERRDLLAGLTEFREHLGGQLTILLLRDIGHPVEVHEIDPRVMTASILALSQYAPVCSL